MILGIVGSEGAKFTSYTEHCAKHDLRFLIGNHLAYGPVKVVSGECHLGGIDIWAKEIALEIGLKYEGFLPKTRNWIGFKARNIQIAEASDRIVCITVRELPSGFKEGGWERYCYHCKTDQHIKSGGCWTVKYAREKLGKPGEIIVI